MHVEHFVALVAEVTGAIEGLPVDKALEAELNRRFPADGEVFQRIAAACREGVSEGWMCKHEQGGIRFGRVAKPGPQLHGFSIDVVEMADVVGPHHEHPQGEVDMIMPLEGDARFALAKALVADDREPERAKELADQAEALFRRSKPVADDQLNALAEWRAALEPAEAVGG